jgi:hypothetical protein
MKTQTRQTAEQIRELTGMSLIQINAQAFEYIELGFFNNRFDALNYILEMTKEESK